MNFNMIKKSNGMKNIFKIIFVFAFVFSCQRIFAADFIVSKELPATDDIKVGDEVLVTIGFAAEGVTYNAFEGTIVVDESFEVLKTVTGSSFVTVWLDNPADFDSKEITFSGITPAGYNKERGIVFSLVLKAVSAKSGIIKLTESSVYRNDGAGTKDVVPESSLRLNVREPRDGEESYLISVRDVTAPEPFQIKLEDDTSGLFGGFKVLIWNTVDKASGISGYDLHIGRKVFKQVESPYVLEKGAPHGKIRVIAYDYEGNTREATLIPPGTVCVPGACVSTVFAIVLVIVIGGLVIIWRKRKK